MKKTSISLFKINAGDSASGLGPKKQPDGSDGTVLPYLRDWVSDYLAGMVPYALRHQPGLSTGGERGIRTPDTRKGIHAFEARAFSHSAISPRRQFHFILSGKLLARIFPAPLTERSPAQFLQPSPGCGL